MKKTKLLIILLSLSICGCSSSVSFSDSPTTMESTVSIAETTTLSVTEIPTESVTETTDSSIIETTATADTANLDPTLSDEHASVLDFTHDVWDAIEGSIGDGESITNMDYSFNKKHLIITVELLDGEYSNGISHQDIAISRVGSITDPILDLLDHYDLWDAITVDFGTWGYSKNTKADIADGDMPYFENIELQSH